MNKGMDTLTHPNRPDLSDHVPKPRRWPRRLGVASVVALTMVGATASYLHLQSKIEAQAETISSQADEIDALRSSFGSVSGLLAGGTDDLSSRVDHLQTGLATVASAVDDINGSVDDLKDDVASVEGRADCLDSGMAQFDRIWGSQYLSPTYIGC